VEDILLVEKISISRACRLIHLTRSMFYYQVKKNDDPVISKLLELSEKYPTRGFDTYYGKIRMEGFPWNRKRVLRVYRSLNLKMRRKSKRRLPSRIKNPLEVPTVLNDTWSIDFMSDSLTTGRRFRILNVIDDYNREALINEAHYSIPADRLVNSLKQLFLERSKPKIIRTDNGPEFISNTFSDFCKINQIELQYIQPGKPTQNAYIERFNRTFREDVLDAYLFDSLQQVNLKAYEWQIDYNANHPHKALKRLSPWLFVAEKLVNEIDN
jgi:putative transposase